VTNPILVQSPQNEEDLQDSLIELFRANDWTALKEVTPDWGQKRVDIIAEHSEYGRIGIETKFIRTGRDGRRLAEAFLQVTRDYWHKNYNRDKIELWAIAPYFQPGSVRPQQNDNHIQDFVKQFLTRVGVGVLDVHADTIKIEFSASSRGKAVPIAGPHIQTYKHRLNIDAVYDFVKSRREERQN
jgi:hypothetical protein